MYSNLITMPMATTAKMIVNPSFKLPDIGSPVYLQREPFIGHLPIYSTAIVGTVFGRATFTGTFDPPAGQGRDFGFWVLI
jgi:hypothetical protein